MATTTRTSPAAPTTDRSRSTLGRAATAARRFAAAAMALVPVLFTVGVLALAVANPALAFVVFGLPLGVAVAVGTLFGVARVGAAVAERAAIAERR